MKTQIFNFFVDLIVSLIVGLQFGFVVALLVFVVMGRLQNNTQ